MLTTFPPRAARALYVATAGAQWTPFSRLLCYCSDMSVNHLLDIKMGAIESDKVEADEEFVERPRFHR